MRSSDVPDARIGRLLSFVTAAALTLAAADRIDFLQHKASFTLTPFLVLGGLATLMYIPYLGRVHPLVTSRAIGLLLLAFVTNALISILVQPNQQWFGGRRVILVSAVILFSVVVCRILASPNRVSLRGVMWSSIVISATFDLEQATHWVRGLAVTSPSGWLFGDYIDITPLAVGTYFPRLSGMSGDPNRAAITLTLLLLLTTARARLRRAELVAMYVSVGLLELFTYSRSGLLTFVLVVLMVIAASPLGRSVKLGVTAFLIALAALITPWVLRVLGLSATAGTIISFRATDQGSTATHDELLTTGLRRAAEFPQFLCCGHGFGMSSLYLQSIFGDNKYGNWHSLYVSTAFETGLIGLLILFALLVGVGRTSVGVRVLVAVGVFCFTYDLQQEPLYWISLIAGAYGLFGPNRNRMASIALHDEVLRPGETQGRRSTNDLADRIVIGRSGHGG